MTDEQTIRDALIKHSVALPVRGALDRLVARAETAERRLRDAPLGGDGSHWDGCWRSHIDCAVARAETAEHKAEAKASMLSSLADAFVRERARAETAERERDEAREWADQQIKRGDDEQLGRKAAGARVAALEAALRDVHRECHRWWGATYRSGDFYRDGLEAVDAIARAALAAATPPAEDVDDDEGPPPLFTVEDIGIKFTGGAMFRSTPPAEKEGT